eukprot:Nk52_evm3s859 gene=Nk52_evmTU3s859
MDNNNESFSKNPTCESCVTVVPALEKEIARLSERVSVLERKNCFLKKQLRSSKGSEVEYQEEKAECDVSFELADVATAETIPVEVHSYVKDVISSVINPQDKYTERQSTATDFSIQAQNPSVRLLFALYLDQLRSLKHLKYSVFHNLVRYLCVILSECHKHEDYNCAKTIMNLCFTFNTTEDDGSKVLIFEYLKHLEIWNSSRFWEAVCMLSFSTECNRVSIVSESMGDEEGGNPTDLQANSLSLPEASSAADNSNTMFAQLAHITTNMAFLGVPVGMCRQLISKFSKMCALEDEHVSALSANLLLHAKSCCDVKEVYLNSGDLLAKRHSVAVGNLPVPLRTASKTLSKSDSSLRGSTGNLAESQQENDAGAEEDESLAFKFKGLFKRKPPFGIVVGKSADERSIIVEIKKETPASFCEALEVGDFLLGVNGAETEQMPVSQVNDLLRSSKKDVHLLVEKGFG